MTGRRRRVAAAVVVLMAAPVALLITGRPPTQPSVRPDAIEQATTFSAPPPASEPSPSTRPRPDTAEPVRHARSVAVELFSWNTRLHSRAGRVQQVLRHADPSGVETLGLLADLEGYLPSESAWQQLRTYDTTQRLEIHDADIPETWDEVLATYGEELLNGATAVTITGIRHRSGWWDEQEHHSQHPVALTVFLRCTEGPAGCHILRLSTLGRTLS
jgi:hypothetical protein